jgi:N utilization substance protein A
LIQIRAIARDPGKRSKVAVQSFDERVDPVGACVGMKGVRIHSIVRELNNENIDLIEYSDDPKVFIQRALLPAQIKDLQLSLETKTANIIVAEEQVPLAIGTNGQNIRLASILTGYSLTLIKEGVEDIEIAEFNEEIGEEIVNKLIAIGINTAREFLETEPSALLAIDGIDVDFIKEVRNIVLTEFEEEEDENYSQKLEEVVSPQIEE